MNNFEPGLYIRGGKILQLRDDGRVHDHCHVGNLGKIKVSFEYVRSNYGHSKFKFCSNLKIEK